jgi:hypothetical protein
MVCVRALRAVSYSTHFCMVWVRDATDLLQQNIIRRYRPVFWYIHIVETIYEHIVRYLFASNCPWFITIVVGEVCQLTTI